MQIQLLSGTVKHSTALLFLYHLVLMIADGKYVTNHVWASPHVYVRAPSKRPGSESADEQQFPT